MAEQRATAAGAPEVRVEVLHGNKTPLALYRRAGFAPYLQTLVKRLSSPAPDE